MPAKSKYGRNIPFGSKSSKTTAQRRSIIDPKGTHKTGEQMTEQEKRNYISKVKAEIQRQRESKKKSKPVAKRHKHLGRQNMPHYKYKE